MTSFYGWQLALRDHDADAGAAPVDPPRFRRRRDSRAGVSRRNEAAARLCAAKIDSGMTTAEEVVKVVPLA